MLAGGTWIAQNKVLPGTYSNFKSANSSNMVKKKTGQSTNNKAIYLITQEGYLLLSKEGYKLFV